MNWMGQQQRVIGNRETLKYYYYCSNGHDEVQWRGADKQPEHCWMCDAPTPPGQLIGPIIL